MPPALSLLFTVGGFIIAGSAVSDFPSLQWALVLIGCALSHIGGVYNR
jgi:hypothetical protein